MRTSFIFCFIFQLHQVHCESYPDLQSFRLCAHWIVSHGSRRPEFMQWITLNDVTILYHDSNMVSIKPCPDWLSNSTTGQQHWRYMQHEADHNKQFLTQGFKSAIQQFNRTGSLSVYNAYQGSGCCHLYQNGTYTLYLTHSFNGKDFVSFDFERKTFVAAVHQAVLYKQLRNKDTVYLQEMPTLYKTLCLERLKMFKLAPKVRIKKVPELRIFEKKMVSSIKVTCHVTGFYPRAVQVVWLGPDLRLVDEGITDVLPNEDGTYQTRRSVIVPEEDVGEHTYSCVVLHISVTGNITRVWDVEERSRVGVWTFLVFVCLSVAGLGLWRCWRSNDALM